MDVLPKSALFCALAISAAVCLPDRLLAQKAVTVESISLVSAAEDFEIEITSSAPITPQSQVIDNPQRLVIDFLQAVPGPHLRNLSVNRGEVKSVRVGLFASHPPVTRVVLDLKGPQSYEVLPSRNKVLVKVGESGTPMQTAKASLPGEPLRPSSTTQPAPVVAPPPPPPAPKVIVHFQNGLLSITAERASLAEVLAEVQRRTGASIPIPAGADQEQVVAKIGPLPAEAALASMLNGSRFNFILVGSEGNPAALQSVILTPKSGLPEGQVISTISPVAQPVSRAALVPVPPPPASDEDDSEDADEPPDQPAPPPQQEAPQLPQQPDQAQPH